MSERSQPDQPDAFGDPLAAPSRSVGIVGAFIGSWPPPQLGIVLGAGIVAAIVHATIRALILLVILGLVQRGTGWRFRRR